MPCFNTTYNLTAAATSTVVFVNPWHGILGKTIQFAAGLAGDHCVPTRYRNRLVKSQNKHRLLWFVVVRQSFGIKI